MRKTKFILSLVSLALLAICSVAATAQTTEFTYQGRLVDGGIPPTANYDLQFELFDAFSNGNQKGSTITLNAVQVTDGVFTVRLDFGPEFDGNARFLQIAVRATGSPNQFTTLSPRQTVNSSPYAVRSKSSATADNASDAAKLGGIDAGQYTVTTDPRLSDARDPLPNSPSYIQNTVNQQAASNFNISGTGTANAINSVTGYQIAGTPVLRVPGNLNLFVADNVGTANTTGQKNTFAGSGTGQVNTSGSFNSFFGALAGNTNTIGSSNSFFGSQAGRFTINGGGNSFFGSGAGQQNTTGSDNSFFGLGAGNSNTTGNSNSIYGSNSGLNVTTGNGNSFFGIGTGAYGNPNFASAFGASAGLNSNGDENSFFGHNAGFDLHTGDHVTMIGAYTNVSAPNLVNSTAIGANAFVGQSNSLVLGSINGVNNATADTRVGIGTTAPSSRFHISDNAGNIVFGNGGCNGGFAAIGFAPTLTCTNYSLLGEGTNTVINRPTGGVIEFRENNVTQVAIGSGGRLSVNTLGTAGTTSLCRNAFNQISNCSSSLRYKKNIDPFKSGLNLVKQLRPITFDWKDGGMHDLGLGAEDVARVNELLVVRNEKGEVEGVKYDRIGVVLINAVKEQQEQIERQNHLIAQLELRLAQIEDTQRYAKRSRRSKNAHK